ncbi:MAG TPA: presenilin family intramembrane aspartyl protease [archaeon]|jgi:presenilin-like A22 family membrane protease|nr:presenilin family intramembrane aspartyl protease [archaeon]
MYSALKDRKFLLSFLFLFLLVQIIAIIVTINYLPQNLQLTLVNKDPNSVWNALFIVGYIIFFTAIIIVLRKIFKKQNYLVVIEALALFGGVSLIFSIFLHTILAYIATICLLLIKYSFTKETIYTKWYNNILLAMAIAGAGAIIGISLGIIPVIVLLILLAVYDIISVFFTKHMITLADMIIKKKISLLFILPTKKREYKLGGGDLVIPALVSSSLFALLIKKYSILQILIPISAIWISSIAGLFLTFYILDRYKTKVKALPALPIQVALMLVVIIITLISS